MRSALTELEALTARRYVPAVFFAAVYAGFGEAERACDWLERAFAERSSWLVFLRVDPWWDSLRANERFIRLLQQLRLPRES